MLLCLADVRLPHWQRRANLTHTHACAHPLTHHRPAACCTAPLSSSCAPTGCLPTSRNTIRRSCRPGCAAAAAARRLLRCCAAAGLCALMRWEARARRLPHPHTTPAAMPPAASLCSSQDSGNSPEFHPRLIDYLVLRASSARRLPFNAAHPVPVIGGLGPHEEAALYFQASAAACALPMYRPVCCRCCERASCLHPPPLHPFRPPHRCPPPLRRPVPINSLAPVSAGRPAAHV